MILLVADICCYCSERKGKLFAQVRTHPLSLIHLLTHPLSLIHLITHPLSHFLVGVHNVRLSSKEMDLANPNSNPRRSYLRFTSCRYPWRRCENVSSPTSYRKIVGQTGSLSFIWQPVYLYLQFCFDWQTTIMWPPVSVEVSLQDELANHHAIY